MLKYDYHKYASFSYLVLVMIADLTISGRLERILSPLSRRGYDDLNEDAMPLPSTAPHLLNSFHVTHTLHTGLAPSLPLFSLLVTAQQLDDLGHHV